jgi:hypothetical protein
MDCRAAQGAEPVTDDELSKRVQAALSIVQRGRH